LAEKYGFFNSVGEDREYLADEFSKPFGALLNGQAGVVLGIDDGLAPSIVTGREVNIASGFAFCGLMPGWWYQSTAEETVTLDPADTGKKRVDLIVLRLDNNTEARKISIEVIKGDEVPGTPSIPTPTKNATTYELEIAEANINVSTLESIKDVRHYANTSGEFIDVDTIPEGECALKKTDGTWYTEYEGYALSTGNQLALSGTICALPNLSLEEGYAYYVQSDGSIDLGATEKLAGYAIGDNMFIVDLGEPKGITKEYNGLMQNLNAIPGKNDGSDVYARINFQLPEDADGAEIRYKTSAWASGDTRETGTQIDELTSDTNLYGDNKWYEFDVSGASEEDYIYFKIFPKKGTVYNETIGVNEIATEVGLLLYEYTFDDVAGSVINDTSGSGNDATEVGLSFTSVIIGDGADGNSGYATLASEISDMKGKTFTCWAEGGSVDSGLFGDTGTRPIGARLNTSNNVVVCTDGDEDAAGSIGTGAFIGVEFSEVAGANCKVYINGSKTHDATWDGNGGNHTIDRIAYCKAYSTVHDCDAEIDQVRFWSGILSAETHSQLYNGGAGC